LRTVKKNIQLKEEKDKNQKEVTRLEQKNEAIHKTIERLGGKRVSELLEDCRLMINCSHRHEMFSSKKFNLHNCDLPI